MRSDGSRAGELQHHMRLMPKAMTAARLATHHRGTSVEGRTYHLRCKRHSHRSWQGRQGPLGQRGPPELQPRLQPRLLVIRLQDDDTLIMLPDHRRTHICLYFHLT
jgi:hypothetical protein